MVKISSSGSGEGPGWVTAPGYSTTAFPPRAPNAPCSARSGKSPYVNLRAALTYAIPKTTPVSASHGTFVPGAANRIATGRTTVGYLDTTAPTNTTLYYAVRAESDEHCSTGPANGGVTDANLVRRSARDDTAQPPPGSVGSTVRLRLINGANVRVTWGAAANAAAYHVLRASSPARPFDFVEGSSALLFDDLNRATVGSIEYYLVKAADSCGAEGP